MITGQAAFSLKEVEDSNQIDYEAEALITGSLARLNPRFIEGVIQAMIQLGLRRLDEQLLPPLAELMPAEPGIPINILELEGQIMQIVDLTVPIGEDTLSPPSVNLQLKLTSYHRGPTFWQASKVEMLLHTGSHVDFARHVQEFGETAVDVDLSRVFGEALVVNLSFAGPNHEISVADLEAHAPEIRPGDIVLVGTDWTEKQWGNFPTYYMESPYCSPQAARWLVQPRRPGDRFRLFQRVLRPPAGFHMRRISSSKKWAGIWIRNQSGQGATIYTTVSRVAYYAEGSYQYVDFKKTRIEEIKRLMEEKKGFYLVIQEKEASFLSSEDQWIVEVQRLEGKGLKPIIVYQKIR